MADGDGSAFIESERIRDESVRHVSAVTPLIGA